MKRLLALLLCLEEHVVGIVVVLGLDEIAGAVTGIMAKIEGFLSARCGCELLRRGRVGKVVAASLEEVLFELLSHVLCRERCANECPKGKE